MDMDNRQVVAVGSCRNSSGSFVVQTPHLCATPKDEHHMDTWTSLKNGREAFADYLTTLAPDDWNRPSLCAGWTVKDVAAHMLVIPTKPKGTIFRHFLASGFNLDKMNAGFVTAIAASMSTSDIASATRSSAGSHGRPPGLPLPGVFNELVVHSLDIADAVGKPFALPTADYVASLEHLKATQPVFKSKERVAGLRLRATDAEWSSGDGPLVEGPIQQLVLAVAGRPSAIDRLSGDGVATFRRR
jgi:uncharacterized protein (TIGR03083 family)